MASAGDDMVVATLATDGWRHGPLLDSTILVPADDVEVTVRVTPDADGTDYTVDVGPRDQRWYETRNERVTTLRMRTRRAAEVLAVLRALGHLAGPA